ncbi:hypothetical protein PtA15_17A420 [Puccinia triticina]|uniref:Uncharacterized protein n=1 Tax=Puccinia triticina TaxID=208348 RepID=A0ABY7D8M9_9BASI|nr:uncharacterized protein PtA15_17A420 [Puccinia triticina]WAQ92938.1 hypothetical protein PtA15_17A420 [Puccinia triticina]
MQDVIDIFKPVSSNKGKVLEVKGKEEGDYKDEEEVDAPNDSGWFPFGGLLGSNHKSGEAGTFRAHYLKVCILMELCGTNLRKWTSIWRMRKSLRAILNMQPIQRESVFNNQ